MGSFGSSQGGSFFSDFGSSASDALSGAADSAAEGLAAARGAISDAAGKAVSEAARGLADRLPEGLPAVGGEDGFGGFGGSILTDSIGRGGVNNPGDVEAASSFLSANGFLDGITDQADEGFFRGIERAQGALSKITGGGLLTDGRVEPFGPSEILAQRAVTSGKMTISDFLNGARAAGDAPVPAPGPVPMPSPGPSPVPDLPGQPGGNGESQPERRPSPSLPIDPDSDDSGGFNPGRPLPRPINPNDPHADGRWVCRFERDQPVTGLRDAFSFSPENQRLAEGMTGNEDIDGIIKDVIGALANGGARAQDEVRDLISQTREVAPKQAETLERKITESGVPFDPTGGRRTARQKKTGAALRLDRRNTISGGSGDDLLESREGPLPAPVTELSGAALRRQRRLERRLNGEARRNRNAGPAAGDQLLPEQPLPNGDGQLITRLDNGVFLPETAAERGTRTGGNGETFAPPSRPTQVDREAARSFLSDLDAGRIRIRNFDTNARDGVNVIGGYHLNNETLRLMDRTLNARDSDRGKVLREIENSNLETAQKNALRSLSTRRARGAGLPENTDTLFAALDQRSAETRKAAALPVATSDPAIEEVIAPENIPENVKRPLPSGDGGLILRRSGDGVIAAETPEQRAERTGGDGVNMPHLLGPSDIDETVVRGVLEDIEAGRLQILKPNKAARSVPNIIGGARVNNEALYLTGQVLQAPEAERAAVLEEIEGSDLLPKQKAALRDLSALRRRGQPIPDDPRFFVAALDDGSLDNRPSLAEQARFPNKSPERTPEDIAFKLGEINHEIKFREQGLKKMETEHALIESEISQDLLEEIERAAEERRKGKVSEGTKRRLREKAVKAGTRSVSKLTKRSPVGASIQTVMTGIEVAANKFDAMTLENQIRFARARLDFLKPEIERLEKRLREWWKVRPPAPDARARKIEAQQRRINAR